MVWRRRIGVQQQHRDTAAPHWTVRRPDGVSLHGRRFQREGVASRIRGEVHEPTELLPGDGREHPPCLRLGWSLGAALCRSREQYEHRRQHQRYNEMLCELRGYDLDRIERNERERIDWAYRELTARRRLAGTTASEHLTAILADEMLTQKEPMAGADPVIAGLWMWHGIEETEHKAVAFDVHVAIGGPVSERRHALILNTFFFLKDTLRNLCIMLQQAGKLWSIREWATGFNYLFIKPGVLRRIVIPWFRFMRKDFHPWQHDNRYLIDAWEQREAATNSPATESG